MGHNGVHTCSRQLRYSRETVALPDGTQKSVRVGHEKGIDLRIGLDLVRLVREDELDVALVFSQDQDLQEAIEEARSIAHSQNRWFKPASAFPNSPTSTSQRGIDRTDWIKVDKRLTTGVWIPPTIARRKADAPGRGIVQTGYFPYLPWLAR
jgi:hypothetical protein